MNFHMGDLRFRLSNLRQNNSQNTVFVSSVNLIALYFSRQPDCPAETAIAPLNPVKIFILLLFLFEFFTLDFQKTMFQSNVEILGV